ncbi:MAG: hypothetical protein M3121_07805, partial [Chloroflexota bacterium]|nr:hypothetical protein [Chloroflexota bacterium]
MSQGQDDAPGRGGQEEPGAGDRSSSPSPRRTGQRAVDAVRARLEPDAGRRPLSVYGVLIIGVVTLLALLAVIYFTAIEQDRPPPICSAVDIAQAERAIRSGDVERVTVVYDETVRTATSERYGPVLARIEYVNGQCANLPQGISGQQQVYAILGLIGFYNNSTETQSVAIAYERQTDLPASLFYTPTPPATATPPPTATASPPPTQPATPVATLTPTPTVAPPPVALETGTPDASP